MKKTIPFKEVIRAERKRRGLTQAQAADLCEVSPRAWWQWEDGQDPLKVTQEGVLARLRADLIPLSVATDELTPDDLAALTDSSRLVLDFAKRLSSYSAKKCHTKNS